MSMQTDIYYMIESFHVYNVNTGKSYDFIVDDYRVATAFERASNLLDEKRGESVESDWILKATMNR